MYKPKTALQDIELANIFLFKCRTCWLDNSE